MGVITYSCIKVPACGSEVYRQWLFHTYNVGLLCQNWDSRKTLSVAVTGLVENIGEIQQYPVQQNETNGESCV